VQDWDRGLIAGETTFGKGLVQRPILLNDDSAVRITIARYYTPSGRTIQRDYKDKKKYVEELMQQDDIEMNNINHDAEKDSTKQKYKTKFGRTVYGGGGITPDYIIEPEYSSEYSNELRKCNIYYQFVRNYLDKYGVEIRKKYAGNLSKCINEFGLNENDMNELIKYAESRNIKFINADYAKDKELIRTRLKAFVARDLFNDIGWYSVLLRIDNQFMKASKLFNEAINLPGFKK
jgi:carboxyl-terminal processing protease